MKVVLAEKPSVARDLASYLQARTRHEGFFEGSGYQVTWALGHLVCLKEPGEYDPKLRTWSLATLPFVPGEFELKLRDDKRGREQFTIVQRLFRQCDAIICATDAGREGELIFRYILTLTECMDKPVQRLWLNSLTREAIHAAFLSMQPLSRYDNLYAAARCRSQADWIVGLNATRNYTVRYGSNGILWSLGRVQTPVLAMIVLRDDQIRTFQPKPFWELLTEHRQVRFQYTGERFDNQDGAEALLQRVLEHPLKIQAVQSKTERSLPPQLYDLTELQRDMNRRFGMSAARTLQIAQSLYERKLITYPRTDSRFLTTDMKKEVPGILQQLGQLKPDEVGKLDLNALPFSRRIVDDRKVTDHHAIIPTTVSSEQLSGQDQKVYDSIVTRLIAAFYPPCLKEVTTVDAVSNEVPFRARGVRVTSPGWTELYPRKPDKHEGDQQQALPEFSPGESGPHKPFVKEGETKPPNHFTENTLLGAMETAGKLVDEGELREALKEKGIGTPATRASIIETLLRRQYITRREKQLIATDLGRYLIALVRDRNLKSPELTGEWEAQLKRIESGKLSPEAFMQDIVEFTRQVVRAPESTPIREDSLGNCPKCGSPVIQGKRGYGCSAWRDGCDFVVWPTYKHLELDIMQVRELLLLQVIREPVTIAGQSVVLSMLDSGDLVEIPIPKGDEQTSAKSPSRTQPRRAAPGKGTRREKHSDRKPAVDLGVCPLCGSQVQEQKKSYGCSRWREGCGFSIWKSISGKRISARTAKVLLADGQTSILKGFKSKSGKPFRARLTLHDGKVGFDFSADRPDRTER